MGAPHGLIPEDLPPTVCRCPFRSGRGRRCSLRNGHGEYFAHDDRRRWISLILLMLSETKNMVLANNRAGEVSTRRKPFFRSDEAVLKSKSFNVQERGDGGREPSNS